MKLLLVAMVVLASWSGVRVVAWAGDTSGANPPSMAGAKVLPYKTINGTTLNLHCFMPDAGTSRPAVVFFFGGGWRQGSPQQFESQCRHLAARGMVAITADYRVASRHQAKPVQCMADARSAIRWVRTHAAELAIDPNRIAAGGGSAGGHLAASTAFIDAFDEPSEDRTVSAVPDALILFNPGLVMAPLDDFTPSGFGTDRSAADLGASPANISPVHHLRASGPPTIILTGRSDTTTPFASAELFTRLMVKAGNRCELVGYDDQIHGFFNREPFKTSTLQAADGFLVSLGWLPTTP